VDEILKGWARQRFPDEKLSSAAWKMMEGCTTRQQSEASRGIERERTGRFEKRSR